MTDETRRDRLMYRVDKERSEPELPRPDLRERIVDTLLDGFGVPLYGGRGMGKSYLIRQLARDLEANEDITVHTFLPPDPEITARTCIGQLAEALESDAELDGPVLPSAQSLVTAWLKDHPTRRLILIYDEVDAYVDAGEFARNLFNGLEAVRKADAELRFAILAAGGLGLALMRSEWASPFVSRGRAELAPTFSMDEIRELAAPLALGEVEDECLSALFALSGGIPFLVVYGLGRLYRDEATRSPAGLGIEFERFLDEHKEFVITARRAIGGDKHVPRRVWTALHASGGLSDSARLLTSLSDLAIDEVDLALDVLRAAGLVTVEGRVLSGRPVPVRLIPSILNLPHGAKAEPADSLRAQLGRDLGFILDRVRRWGMSFFRRGGQLVPEAAFQASISIALSGMGWHHVEQETQRGPGRSDIVAEHPDFDGGVVIEIKIWGRNDYTEIASQVEDYRDGETRALATVMISDNRSLTAEDYRAACFAGVVEALDDVPEGLVGCSTRTTSAEWATLPVDHYMVKLLRRA